MRLQVRKPVIGVALALSLLISAVSVPASASEHARAAVGSVHNFGPNLQQVAGGACRQPEGLAIDPAGNLYAASNSDSAIGVGHVCRLDRSGRLTRVYDVPAGAVPAIGLLGELWVEGHLLVLDQADDVAPHGRLLSLDVATGRVVTLATGFTFPNALAIDAHGYLYISDSVQGRIYRLRPDGSHLSVWADSPLLRSTNPDLPLGANGLAFDRGRHTLYVANTGDRRILTIPLQEHGAAGAIGVFADGAALDGKLGLPSPTALFAADGIQFDVDGNLYVMANQVNEVQVLSPSGRLIHRYSGVGDAALDFNASAVFCGSHLFITNMSAADGGVNSKLSVLQTPHPGLLCASENCP